MNIYPEDAKKIAEILRTYELKALPGEVLKTIEWADSLDRIANESIAEFGDRATVSVSVSAYGDTMLRRSR